MDVPEHPNCAHMAGLTADLRSAGDASGASQKITLSAEVLQGDDAPGHAQHPSRGEHPILRHGEHRRHAATGDEPFRATTGEEGEETLSSSSPSSRAAKALRHGKGFPHL